MAEQAGLAVAIALHAALGGVLAWQMADPPEIPVIAPPKGMVVSLATDVSLESTSPNPVAVARASRAPVRGEPVPEPEPRRVTEAPKTAERKESAPSARATPKTSPKKPPKQPTKPSNPKSNNSKKSDPRKNKRNDKPAGGGSQFDNAFENGFGNKKDGKDENGPGKNLGPTEMASLETAVGRLVRAKWQGRVPQGPDAEKLVTRVSFRLNPNGTLRGEPQVLGTTGVTDLNRNQIGRHQEEAVRAIKLVGRFQLPFDVPADHPGFTLRFDR